MKNVNNIIIIVLLVFNFSNYTGYSQNENEDTNIINQYFQLNKEASLILENKAPVSSNKIQSQINFVNLNQVGNSNIIDVKQKGKDSQSVNQVGNKNYYSFINYYNNTPSNFNIIQQGSSNGLQIYGENSIIKNMSVVQKTNFKTLIIKNF